MCFISNFCFCFGQILFNLAFTFTVHLEKDFIPAFPKVLFDNLESGKKIIVLEKSLEKVLNFGSKNLYDPCTKLSCLRTRHDQGFYEIVQVFSPRSLKPLEDGVLEKLMFRYV